MNDRQFHDGLRSSRARRSAPVCTTHAWHRTHMLHVALSVGTSNDLRIVNTISLYVPQELIQCQWQNLRQHSHLACHEHWATIPAHGYPTLPPTIHKQAPLRIAPRSNPFLANPALAPSTAHMVVASLASARRSHQRGGPSNSGDAEWPLADTTTAVTGLHAN